MELFPGDVGLLEGIYLIEIVLCRCLVDPLRPMVRDDISEPLSNSFIHTGHGSAFGESWGSPAYIDEMYLRNPMEPPDVLGVERGKIVVEKHATYSRGIVSSVN